MAPAFASASATGPELEPLLGEVASRALAALGPGGPPDLAVLFATPDFGPGSAGAGPRVAALTGARRLLGCSGGGVIGAEAEREGGRSAALLLGRLPGTEILPFHLRQDDLVAFDGPEAVRRLLGVEEAGSPSFLLLPDPFSVDGDGLLAALNEAFPGRPVMGGVASGAHRPGGHALWLDGEVHREGAVGVALRGGSVVLRPVVSQGCRPVGRRYAVTRAEGPRIHALAGKPAAEALKETVAALSERDRALARTSLHLGRVAHEARDEFRRGDFLIRNLVAIVPEDGSLVVGDHARVGQTVQFQLRDAETAAEDLAELLGLEAAAGRPAAGLLFNCGGRGSHLFAEPDHDISLLRSRLGEFPLAGFFCNGEIGPVGPRNFLHGFTASLALFAPRPA
ncbi:MAG: FIST C-terminal domain-containing protein [Planctomycetes bacterium]|nr:FIST C-terminal domain-containing protein [Planctomycetota bacterium]